MKLQKLSGLFQNLQKIARLEYSDGKNCLCKIAWNINFIDVNLRWQMHINKLSKKVVSRIGAIKRMRDFVPTPTLHYIYNTLIQCQFNDIDCNIVWVNFL